jgi:class 3 adenylate cyclase
VRRSSGCSVRAEGAPTTAVGNTVNLAARLEGGAPVGGVAPATVARLSRARTEPLGAVTVNGKEAPVDHRLVVLDGGNE